MIYYRARQLRIGGLYIGSNAGKFLAYYHPMKSRTWYWALSFSERSWDDEAYIRLYYLALKGGVHYPKPNPLMSFIQIPRQRDNHWIIHIRLPYGRSVLWQVQNFHKKPPIK